MAMSNGLLLILLVIANSMLNSYSLLISNDGYHPMAMSIPTMQS